MYISRGRLEMKLQDAFYFRPARKELLECEETDMFFSFDVSGMNNPVDTSCLNAPLGQRACLRQRLPKLTEKGINRHNRPVSIKVMMVIYEKNKRPDTRGTRARKI